MVDLMVTSDMANRPGIENFRAVIFDCDDTVIETARLRWSVLIGTAASFDIELTEDTIRRSWGKPFPALIGALVPGLDFDEFVARYSADMLRHKSSPTRGAVELLSYSRSIGQILQIVTSSSRSLILQDLRQLKLEQYFEEIHGYEQSQYHKPDPRVLESPLKFLADRGIEHVETVYIGDSVRDYSAAVGNGIEFICVLTGIETRDEVIAGGVNPLAIVEDLTALLPIGS